MYLEFKIPTYEVKVEYDKCLRDKKVFLKSQRQLLELDTKLDLNPFKAWWNPTFKPEILKKQRSKIKKLKNKSKISFEEVYNILCSGMFTDKLEEALKDYATIEDPYASHIFKSQRAQKFIKYLLLLYDSNDKINLQNISSFIVILLKSEHGENIIDIILKSIALCLI